MSLESEIYSRLSGFSALTDIISTRIHPLRMPQNGTLPAVTYMRVSTERISAFGGDTGDIRARVQFDVWADNAENTLAVSKQIQTALQRHSSGNIQDVFFENERHEYEEDAELFRTNLDFMFWYKE